MVALAWEHHGAPAGQRVQFLQDGHGLLGQRHQMWLAMLLAILAALHASGGDRPKRGIQIDFGPGGGAQFARPLEQKGASCNAARTTGPPRYACMARNSSPSLAGSVMAAKCLPGMATALP